MGVARWPGRGLGALDDLAQEGVGGKQRCSLVARQGETALVTAPSELLVVLSFRFRRSELRGERLPCRQGAALGRREGIGHKSNPSLPTSRGFRATVSGDGTLTQGQVGNEGLLSSQGRRYPGGVWRLAIQAAYAGRRPLDQLFENTTSQRHALTRSAQCEPRPHIVDIRSIPVPAQPSSPLHRVSTGRPASPTDE